ncbi:MAG: Ldh family oxidoreductase [Alphaproteobacteria bacterium]|nr:Ldh family oxidoreductase [Alphaproteobacteria bacterium]
MRLAQYAEQLRDGLYVAAGEPRLARAEGGAALVDGGNGLGMPAMRLATDTAIEAARREGSSAVGVANVAHTGRLGAFAERAAEAGCLAIIIDGGSRAQWRQVAPHGGARAMLPTNPYALGLPGGERGPVVIDFATAAAAGGKVFAARQAARDLPAGICIDARGRPTTDPNAYYDGGALLPMAGAKGYGLALVAELIGEAILGESKSGMNWIVVCVDLARFRAPTAYLAAAEACLAELRDCPPAPGFERVEVPGEREAAQRAERLRLGIPMAPATRTALIDEAAVLGVDATELRI